MFKPFDKQEDVPEALREHYSKREDGKWHPDINSDHPAVKHNAKLLSEKATAEGKVTKLESDLESARAGNLGRGQTAISSSDAKLLDQYKALGTPDEVGAIKTEHATLKEKDTKRVREDSLRQLAKDYGYNEEAFVRLPGLPEFESRAGKDGKTEWFAKLIGADKVVSEKSAKEWIEASADIKPFMASLTQKSDGVRVPTTGPTTQPASSEPYAWAKQFAEDYSKQNAPTVNLVDAWNGNSKPAA